jgi:DNA repair protein RadA/Sms
MAKVKTVYFCQNCGSQSPQWVGKCHSCGEFNTYVEEVVQKAGSNGSPVSSRSPKAIPIEEINVEDRARHKVVDQELSRVLGGGIVPGSVVLVGGEPGIGKSTLMLQLALQEKNLQTLYVSGEESEQQIRMRAERVGSTNDCLVLTETETSNIFRQIDEHNPSMVIIDSIQTLHSNVIESAPGSVSQIRECTSQLIKFAKVSQIPVFLIGHITKEGTLAGPKVLEHMVDTVLQFEGDRNHVYRLLRAVKNRFGSTNELGIYEMHGAGLRQVSNPSEILISSQEGDLSGSAIAATIEGLRPMLIEIQALVSSAVYGTPQRSATGFDLRRMNMLLAVLEKRCGFKLGMKDVFLNMAGGVKVDDPASDLAVVAAVLSSSEDMAVPRKYAFAGEIGLSGEIRAVTRVEQRISEAEKLGFEKIFISKHNPTLPDHSGIELVRVSRIEQVFQHLFG